MNQSREKFEDYLPEIPEDLDNEQSPPIRSTSDDLLGLKQCLKYWIKRCELAEAELEHLQASIVRTLG